MNNPLEPLDLTEGRTFECRCSQLAAIESDGKTVVYDIDSEMEIFSLPGSGLSIDLLSEVAKIQADAAMKALEAE